MRDFMLRSVLSCWDGWGCGSLITSSNVGKRRLNSPPLWTPCATRRRFLLPRISFALPFGWVYFLHIYIFVFPLIRWSVETAGQVILGWWDLSYRSFAFFFIFHWEVDVGMSVELLLLFTVVCCGGIFFLNFGLDSTHLWLLCSCFITLLHRFNYHSFSILPGAILEVDLDQRVLVRCSNGRMRVKFWWLEDFPVNQLCTKISAFGQVVVAASASSAPTTKAITRKEPQYHVVRVSRSQ